MPYHVLFLCTGNSARSIMAEAILNFRGRPTFVAHSAGSHPSGIVRPEGLHQLHLAHIPTPGLRSKTRDEFAQPDAPKLDFVFTVCDNAAKEVCPIWPGQPMTAHWGVPDPAAVRGSKADIERAFREAFFILDLYAAYRVRWFEVSFQIQNLANAKWREAQVGNRSCTRDEVTNPLHANAAVCNMSSLPSKRTTDLPCRAPT